MEKGTMRILVPKYGSDFVDMLAIDICASSKLDAEIGDSWGWWRSGLRC